MQSLNQENLNEVLAYKSWFTVGIWFMYTGNHHLAAIFCFDHNFLNESTCNTGFFICNFKTVCDFIVVESMGFIFFYSVCVIHVLLLFSDNSSNKKKVK